MTRIALGIEYDGSHYHGWQRQANLPTVQLAVEKALSFVANTPITVQCAGRTDTNVHAFGQVVHFDTELERSLTAWTQGVNTQLPPDICVRWAQPVSDDFHARFGATARHYCYLIDNQPTSPAILHQRVTWHPRKLDVNRMIAAATHWIGEHDFSSFRGAHCQSKSPMRHVYHVDVSMQLGLIKINIKANAFLHHMVRNMVGVLMLIGEGKQPSTWAKTVLEAKDRQAAAQTAPATGLYLMEVDYPLSFQLPKARLFPF